MLMQSRCARCSRAAVLVRCGIAGHHGTTGGVLGCLGPKKHQQTTITLPKGTRPHAQRPAFVVLVLPSGRALKWASLSFMILLLLTTFIKILTKPPCGFEKMMVFGSMFKKLLVIPG